MALEVKPEPQGQLLTWRQRWGGKERGRGTQGVLSVASPKEFLVNLALESQAQGSEEHFSHDPHFVLLLQGLVSFLIYQGIYPT